MSPDAFQNMVDYITIVKRIISDLCSTVTMGVHISILIHHDISWQIKFYFRHIVASTSSYLFIHMKNSNALNYQVLITLPTFIFKIHHQSGKNKKENTPLICFVCLVRKCIYSYSYNKDAH